MFGLYESYSVLILRRTLFTLHLQDSTAGKETFVLELWQKVTIQYLRRSSYSKTEDKIPLGLQFRRSNVWRNHDLAFI